MPNSSSPFHLVAAAMLWVLAFPLAIIGVVGLARFDEMWWLYGLLAASGGLMLGGGAATALRWHRAQREEERTEREMLDAARLRLHASSAPAAISGRVAEVEPAAVSAELAAIPVGSPRIGDGAAAAAWPAPGETVLAHWTYPPAEWSAYTRREARYRAREALVMAVGTVVLGTPILGVLDGKWGLALAVSAAVGAVIGVGRGIMAAAVHRANAAARHGEAIIGPTALLLNGRYQVLDDGRIRFGGARLLEGERPPLLELTVLVPGKYRRVPEEVRVPIPAGKEDEARALIEALRRIHPDAPAR